VKAGVRLLIAEARVGELYSIPLQPTIRDMNPTSASKKILKKTGVLAEGNRFDLHINYVHILEIFILVKST
jgi:N-acyl-D-aspartate/D-glutamate deacylase